MAKYEVGTTATLYANFLTLENKEPSTVVDPKITIRHIDGSNVLVTDVAITDMTFVTESLYYYKWDIPAGADLCNYTVEYQATIDGEYAEGNETIQVVAAGTGGAGVTGVLYTTKSKVAGYLGVDVSKIQDDWIDWASRYIDLYTNHIFYEITVTEKYDINESGQSILFLDNFPVISVTELKNDGDVMATDDYLVYNGEGMIKIADDFIGNIYNVGAFIYGRQKVEVTYKHGYSNVPQEITWACTIIASQIAYASLIKSGDITAASLIEEDIGEYSYKKSTRGSAFSEKVEKGTRIAERLEEDVFSAKNVLRLYRTRKMGAV